MFWILVSKDFLCLWRSRHILVGTFGFALLLVVVASFAFRHVGAGQEELQAVTPGIIWIIFLFSGVIALNHTFMIEEENRAMLGVLLYPLDPSIVYLSKWLTNFLFLIVLQVCVIVAHGVLFGVELFGVFAELVFLSALATAGFSAVGTLLAGIAVCSKGREIILPVVLFPLLLPLIASVVYLTRELLFSGAIDFGDFWFVLLLGFDVIALVLSWALFEYVWQ